MIDEFPLRLRRIRHSLALQQEQVAKQIGVSHSTISTYENNTRQPSLEILVRLARLYRVSTDYMLGLSDVITVDLSGLTNDEVNLILALVSTMTKKNEELNDRKNTEHEE